MAHGQQYTTHPPRISIPDRVVGVAADAEQEASQGSSREHKRLAAMGARSTRIATHLAVAGEGYGNNGCAIVTSGEAHKVTALVGLVLVYCLIEIAVGVQVDLCSEHREHIHPSQYVQVLVADDCIGGGTP